MSKILKISAVVLLIMLAGSVGMAQHRGGHYGGGGHYGYYHNGAGELVFGLLGFGVLAAVLESERPVYVQQPVVYQTYAQQPQVIYQAAPVIQQPQVIYQAAPVVQQPPQVVQQPAVVQQSVPVVAPMLSPVTCTVNVTNSNGSYTPVTLRQEGSEWVGPNGEYYSKMPTMDQLRPVYGLQVRQ